MARSAYGSPTNVRASFKRIQAASVAPSESFQIFLRLLVSPNQQSIFSVALDIRTTE